MKRTALSIHTLAFLTAALVATTVAFAQSGGGGGGGGSGGGGGASGGSGAGAGGSGAGSSGTGGSGLGGSSVGGAGSSSSGTSSGLGGSSGIGMPGAPNQGPGASQSGSLQSPSLTQPATGQPQLSGPTSIPGSAGLGTSGRNNTGVGSGLDGTGTTGRSPDSRRNADLNGAGTFQGTDANRNPNEVPDRNARDYGNTGRSAGGGIDGGSASTSSGVGQGNPQTGRAPATTGRFNVQSDFGLNLSAPRINGGGLIVSRVTAGSLAHRLNFTSGDRLISVNGIPLTTQETLSSALGNFNSNQFVYIIVRRGNQLYNLRVRPEQVRAMVGQNNSFDIRR